MTDSGLQSADDGVVETGELPARRRPGCRTAARRVQMMELSKPASPARRRPTSGRSRMPDGGPQSADDGVVEAGELPALPPHTRPEPDAGRDGCPKSADDGVVEAGELPALPPHTQPEPDAGCLPAECR
jgi:hypothetical protein